MNILSSDVCELPPIPSDNYMIKGAISSSMLIGIQGSSGQAEGALFSILPTYFWLALSRRETWDDLRCSSEEAIISL